jgi:hypothetical protein
MFSRTLLSITLHSITQNNPDLRNCYLDYHKIAQFLFHLNNLKNTETTTIVMRQGKLRSPVAI